ncbi:hypothetical protein KORDIASMS9_01813 [Kordia sp. SMS9]|uniref:hypothetical protein n=1 Tax=Kordia sp. SMS9 TaxID=2282170 RepID=UPI000E0E01F9|nr:hypothetical protein [Kordia sp. SMS9]AXG69588.1 hypothetical protein KORDIASMS9_01813 [Kordia sp. SMS9]
MKIQNTFLVLITFLLILSSCASTRFSNLYHTIEHKGEIKDVVSVNVNALPVPNSTKQKEEKPKTFFDLRDSIPHVFLKVIGEKSSDETKIIKAIQSPLSIVKKKTNVSTKLKNLTEIKVRLLFSNIKKYYKNKQLLHPGTRMEFLNTEVKVTQPSDLYIFNIDRLENEFESIDMGTLERTNSVDFSSGISGEATGSVSSDSGSNISNNVSNELINSNTQNVYDINGNLLGTISNGNNTTDSTKNDKSSNNKIEATKGAKADIKFASNEVIKEALNLNYKRLKTGFSFNEKEITISQRGRPLSDISDIVLVTATLKFNQTRVRTTTNILTNFKNLFSNQKSKIADNISLNQYIFRAIYCSNANDVMLDVNYEGIIRAPKTSRRGRNILEYDDKVKYFDINNKTNPKTIAIPKEYYCEDVYYILADLPMVNDLLLKISLPGARKSTLLMHLNDSPKEFVEWIQDQIRNPLATNLQTNKFELIFEKRGVTPVPVVKSTLSSGEISNIQNLSNIRLIKR